MKMFFNVSAIRALGRRSTTSCWTNVSPHRVIPSVWALPPGRRGGASTRGDFATTSLAGMSRLSSGKKLEAFRLDCARIWGNVYDYSRTKYKDNHTPVDVQCPTHGPFRLKPRDHVQRRVGCPKCPAASGVSASHVVAGGVVTRAGQALPSFGQHFLRSRAVAGRIALAAVPDEDPEVSVAEIGVGAGALTRELLERDNCVRVVGFEIDGEMVHAAFHRPFLQRHGVSARDLPTEASRWSRRDWRGLVSEVDGQRLLVVHGDFLQCASIPGQCHVVVGNLPYRVSSRIVTKLLSQRPALRRAVVMVQAEFGRRLLARVATAKYGYLAVMTALTCSDRRQALPGRIPPEAFNPPPRVDSVVVSLTPRPEPLFHEGRLVELESIGQLVRAVLDDRRGNERGLTLLGALITSSANLGFPEGWQEALSRVGGGVAGRLPSVIEPVEFLALAGELGKLGWSTRHIRRSGEDDCES